MKVLLIGDGQLGHMLGRAGIQQGDSILLYSTRTQQVMPLAADLPLAMSLQEAVDWADVVSWEHEAVPAEVIDIAHDKFLMDPDKITSLTDRRSEKSLFDACEVPTSPWRAFTNAAELTELLKQCKQPVVIKAASGGYDGKGQWRWQPGDDIAALVASAGQQAGIVEDMIPFVREVSLVGACDQNGERVCYPLIRNVHTQGILSYSVAGEAQPAQLQQLAEQYFKAITDALDYVGVLAIEFFVVGDGEQAQLLVNEIAPRVHNSGHFSQTGANVDQFALHMRCLTGLPLPELMVAPTLMLNVIGVDAIPDQLWRIATADCHWYNKAPRPGRKVGHVNVMVESTERAEQLASVWTSKLQRLVD